MRYSMVCGSQTISLTSKALVANFLPRLPSRSGGEARNSRSNVLNPFNPIIDAIQQIWVITLYTVGFNHFFGNLSTSIGV